MGYALGGVLGGLCFPGLHGGAFEFDTWTWSFIMPPDALFECQLSAAAMRRSCRVRPEGIFAAATLAVLQITGKLC